MIKNEEEKIAKIRLFECLADEFRRAYFNTLNEEVTVSIMLSDTDLDNVSFYILGKGPVYKFEDMIKFRPDDLKNIQYCIQFINAYPKSWLNKKKEKEWSKRK